MVRLLETQAGSVVRGMAEKDICGTWEVHRVLHGNVEYLDRMDDPEEEGWRGGSRTH
jgi:hypothetical protein